MGRKRASSRKGDGSNAFDENVINIFSTKVDYEDTIKGTRGQQDINLDEFADEKIRELLNNNVLSEDDEDIDDDLAFTDEGKAGWSGDGSLAGLTLSQVIAKRQDKFLEADISGSNSQSRNFSSSRKGHDSGNSDSDAQSGSHDEDEDKTSDSDVEGNSAALENAIRSVAASATDQLDWSSSYKVSLSDLTGRRSLPLVDGNAAAAPLAVPKPKRMQQLIDRSAAYQIAKQNVSEWQDFVNATRDSEKLTFPLAKAGSVSEVSPFAPPPASSANELEKKVQSLLEQSNLILESKGEEEDSLPHHHLDVEDIMEQRRKQRILNEMMYREGVRNRRMNKIKSKKYRRIRKRERMFEEQRMREAELSDSDADDDNIEVEAERERALERMSLRHKNTSEWARNATRLGHNKDAETREDLEQMLQENERLKRKIQAIEDPDDAVSNDDMEGNYHDSEVEDAVNTKGIMGMKFMIEAETRKRGARERLENNEDDFSAGATTNAGRLNFGPKLLRNSEDVAATKADSADESENEAVDLLAQKLNKKHRMQENRDVEIRPVLTEHAVQRSPKKKTVDVEEEDNPWLHINSHRSKSTFKVLDKDSRSEDKAAYRLEKDKAAANVGGKHKPCDVAISVEDTLGTTMIRKDRLTFEQQDQVARAFAGDDVAAEFAAEKERVINEEGDHEVDETLPGWGTWGGGNLSGIKARRIRKVRGAPLVSRRDRGRNAVIISETATSQVSKYHADEVPFPFENRAQYEHTLRMPLGHEWSTRRAFIEQTTPRVIVESGKIIEPLHKGSLNHE